jgi:hypothetical protein
MFFEINRLINGLGIATVACPEDGIIFVHTQEPGFVPIQVESLAPGLWVLRIRNTLLEHTYPKVLTIDSLGTEDLLAFILYHLGLHKRHWH